MKGGNGEQSSSVSRYGDIRALVVDDDVFVLETVRVGLTALGVPDVVCVANVADAEDALSNDRGFNLIVCDLMMPDTDGIEFLRWLAAEHVDVPVVLLSGTEERVLHAAEQLAIEYRLRLLGSLAKPVDMGSLALLLERGANSQLHSASRAANRDIQSEEIEASIQTSVVLHYQPKVFLADRSIAGFEALLRWRARDDSPYSPFSFVRAAEDRHLIDQLTTRVFELAVADLASWREDGCEPAVSLNISAANLKDLSLPESLARRLEEAGLSNDRITLELTETAVVDDIGLSLDILTRIRLKSFHLSLDDFGTGYASLEKLTQMPFTEVKVDRGFIIGARTSPDKAKVLRAAVELAHDLNLTVVAEGVESLSDLKLVESLNCDIAQGFLFSRAIPPEEVPSFVSTWSLGDDA